VKPYRFHSEARAEFRAAADWYRACSDMAEPFVDAVELAVRRIRRLPRSYARWPGIEDEVRRCVLKQFPFVVVYSVEEDGILLLAVAHTSRRPTYWIDRLGR
jgi:plasmid stabilization system protein ParE